MRKMMRVLFCTGLAALMASSSAAAGLQPHPEPRAPVLGSEFRTSGPRATGDESDPAVAWNADDHEYLVVWADTRHQATRGEDIYGRRVAADGTRLGSDFRISGRRATADELWPAVAWNGDTNEYLVVWADRRRDTNRGWAIYGRRIAADGTRLGSDFHISGPHATNYERHPAVAWGPADEYLVVWTDGRDSATRGDDIYGRRVGGDGTRLGDDFRISSPAALGHDQLPDVAWSRWSGWYLVVWTDRRDEATRGWDIYGRRVSGAGAVLGNGFRISGAAAIDKEDHAAVAWNSKSNQFLVVWEDGRDPNPLNTDTYGRLVSAGEAMPGDDFRISGPSATTADFFADVAWSATANRYLVVWTDYRNSATRDTDVYGRRVSATGVMLEDDFRVGGPRATAYDGAPQLASTGTTQYLVVWCDGRNDPSRGYDIYARLVGA